jgi:hypothetical protein
LTRMAQCRDHRLPQHWRSGDHRDEGLHGRGSVSLIVTLGRAVKVRPCGFPD